MNFIKGICCSLSYNVFLKLVGENFFTLEDEEEYSEEEIKDLNERGFSVYSVDQQLNLF